VKRLIVLGGFGFFGRVVMELLRADGLAPLVGSRRASAEVRLDVENPESLRAALRPGDLVVDTIGPFQERSTALVEAAIEVGFDVIDISDSLGYAEKIFGLRDRIDAAGIRVLTACSSISAISAALLRMSEIAEPVRATGFLAPAVRYAAYRSTQASLLHSVGRPVRVRRGGRLMTVTGWVESRRFDAPAPVGPMHGCLFESADSFFLPKVWPSLQSVEFYLDARVPGLNLLLRAAARSGVVWRVVQRSGRAGLSVARWFGPASGCLGYEIEGNDGSVVRCAVVASRRGHVVPAVPAVIAAGAIALGRFDARGLVLPDRQVKPPELVAYLQRMGVIIRREVLSR
jgi:hypothetical protein